MSKIIKQKIVFLLIFIMQMTFISISYGENYPNNDKSAFSIEETTINSIHAALKNHQITCEQLINAYTDRIKKYNLSVQNKPPINAITEINPSALNEARELDKKFFNINSFSGSLFCVPVLVKDNINTYDGTTTAGSYSLLGNQPSKDAFLVSQLRNAGAIILGHGTMDEFAFGMYGISSRSGRTGNSYDTSKNSGGSSAGVAAGISANFAVVGIGTDNSGSIRVPASFNGIVGLRPSTGLISQQGVFPMGNLDGVSGPLTRTVEDLALVLDVIAKPDSQDKKTLNIPRIKSYKTFLKVDGLKQKRIGIVHLVGKVDTFRNMPNETQLMLHKSFQKMQNAGATVIDNITLPEFNTNRKLNMSGTIEDVNKYLSGFPATRKNFQAICESNRTRTFGKNIQECIKYMKSLPNHSSRQYAEVLKMFQKNKAYVEKIMNDNHLDALLIPISTKGIASYDPITINPWQASVSSNAGLPSIVINIGYDHDMPVGIELVGEQFMEGTLIEIAYSYEQQSSRRKLPEMPEPNQYLLNYTIPEFNNFLTSIGIETFDKVLKNGKPGEFAREDLTPEKFKKIVYDKLQKMQKRT